MTDFSVIWQSLKTSEIVPKEKAAKFDMGAKNVVEKSSSYRR